MSFFWINEKFLLVCLLFAFGLFFVEKNGIACTCAAGFEHPSFDQCSRLDSSGNLEMFFCGGEPGHDTSTDLVLRLGTKAPIAAPTAATCVCDSGWQVWDNGSGKFFCAMAAGNDTVTMACKAPAAVAAPVVPATTPIATAATTATTQEITGTGSTVQASQAAVIEDAANISEKGASNRATIGVADCALGANDELAVTGSGAGGLADCQDNFAKANALSAMAAKGGKSGILTADEAVLASSDVQGILDKFEKNFGVSREDYISRMLAAHGSQEELKDLLSSKFSDDKFDKMMVASAEAKPTQVLAEALSGVSLAEAAKKKTDTSLRDSLKKKLSAAPTGRVLASTTVAVVPKRLINPKAVSLDAYVYGNKEQESELSLFEIVRMKYREFTARQRL